MINLWGKLTQAYSSAEKEAENSSVSTDSKKVDYKTIYVCITVAVCLSMNRYFADSATLDSILTLLHLENLRNTIFFSSNSQLYSLAWWVLVLCFFYFFIPVIIVKFFFKEALKNYGLKFKGSFGDYHLYIIMLVVMIPLVIIFSGTKSFQSKYPFYNFGNCCIFSSFSLLNFFSEGLWFTEPSTASVFILYL
jgi:hypothetical protein